MWRIERTRVPIGPRRWHWIFIVTSHGMVAGYAWTKRQAERRLYEAQEELLKDGP